MCIRDRARGQSVIGALGQSLLGSFGQFLSKLGKALIEYGAVAVAKGKLDMALATLFGPALIASGLAAIKLGSIISIVGGAFGGIAKSGLIGGGGDSSMSNDVGGTGSSGSRYSSSNYSSGGMGSGNVVFEIQGTKLVGVLNNTLKRNRSLGGTNNLLTT